MRDRSDETLIRRWLAAERSGDQAAAEETLTALLVGMTGPLAPAWLVGAVMDGIPRVGRWTLERLAAILFVACGMAVFFSRWWFPYAVEGVAVVARWTASVSLAGWLAGGVEFLASLWTVWGETARVGRLVGSSPEGLAVLATCSLLMFGAARALYALLRERSSAHVR